MKRLINKRGYEEIVFESVHLKLKDLQSKTWGHLKNKYLFKGNIPASPRPEFHVSHLKHDTNQAGLTGIRRDSGFRNPNHGSLLWWSLTVAPEEISSAERRLLDKTYPDRTEEQIQQQQSFLKKFLTSPSFDGTSRLGSYRFTFTVEELLKAYRDQFCAGDEPVMRLFKTVLYKQEVMHAVLVHSPANEDLLSDRPLLIDGPDAVCRYRDGHFIWKPEAMCETHRYKLIQRHNEKQIKAIRISHQFYVWDHVSIALHVDKQVLSFHPDQLRERLTFCEKGYPVMIKASEFQDFSAADDFVKGLWPNCSSALRS